MKKVFNFIVLSVFSMLLLVFFAETSSVEASEIHDTKTQLNFNNDSGIATIATTSPLQPVSITVIGYANYTDAQDAVASNSDAKNIYKSTVTAPEPVVPNAPLADQYNFAGLPYKAKAFVLDVEFSDKSIISSVSLSHGSTSVNQNILNGPICLDYPDTSTSAMTDTVSMTINGSTSSSKVIYSINISRLAVSTDNTLSDVSITALKGGEEFDLSVAISTSMTNSKTGTLKITYPEGYDALPYLCEKIDIQATPRDSLSTIQIKIDNVLADSYTFPKTTEEITLPISIIVIPESGTAQQRTYTGTIVRKGPDDNHDIDITETFYTYIDANGTEQTASFDLEWQSQESIGPDGNTKVTLYLSNPDSLLLYSATSVSFKITPKSPSTIIYIGTEEYTDKLFTENITFGISALTKRYQLTIRSEKDILDRPDAPIGTGGEAYAIDISASKPDSTRKITSIGLKNSMEDVLISNNDNTIVQDTTYSYELKKSLVGESFRIDLAWESGFTKAYLSTTNSSSIMTSSNEYNANQVWSIGTPVYLYLRSQNEDYTVFTITTTFADERSTENGIADIEFSYGGTPLDIDFNEAVTAYPNAGSIKVPYSMDKLVVIITLKDVNETLNNEENFISGSLEASTLQVTTTISLVEGMNTVYLQGVSEKNDLGQLYTFTFEREAGKTENYIESLIINGIDCTDASYLGTHFDYIFDREDNFSIYFPRGNNDFTLNFTISDSASLFISALNSSSSSTTYNCSVADGSVLSISVNVKSETEIVTQEGTGRSYTINIYVADQENTLDNLYLYTSESDLTSIEDIHGKTFTFASTVKEQATFTVPFKTKGAYFMPVKAGFNGKVNFGSNGLSKLSDGYFMNFEPQNNVVSIQVLSELSALSSDDDKVEEKSFTYTLNIAREEGAKDATLQDLYVEINGQTVAFIESFSPDTLEYTIEYVPEDTTSVTIYAVATDPNATIDGIGEQTVQFNFDTISQTLNVLVTAEDEVTTKTYQIQLWTTSSDPDDDAQIKSIMYLPNTTLTPTMLDVTKAAHKIDLLATQQGLSLVITKNSPTSTLYVKPKGGEAQILTNGNYSILLEKTNTTKEYEVYCVSEAHTTGMVYTITVTRAPDDNATLKELTYNGTPVSGFTSGMQGGQFEVLVGELDSVTIAAVPTSETATISSLMNPYALTVGDNRITVTATAEDGVTQCSYEINFIKDASAILDGLEAWVDEENKLTNFEPNTFTGYTITLPYRFDSIQICYETEYNTATIITADNTELFGEDKRILISDIQVGTNLYRVRVKTASGKTADYEISITREEPDHDATLKELTYNNGSSISEFSAGMDSATLTVYVKDADTIYFSAVASKDTTIVTNYIDETQPAHLNVGENLFTITTLAEDKVTTCTYTILAIKDAPKTLTQLSVLVESENQIVDYDPETNTYRIELEYEQTSASISYEYDDLYANFIQIEFIQPQANPLARISNTLNIEDIPTGESVYTIRLTPASGEYNEYNITINRDAGSDDNLIKSFTYYMTSEDDSLTELPINETETAYDYIVDRNVVVFNPIIVLSDEKATLTLPDDRTLIPGQANIKNVIVTSQNGQVRTYTFTVYPCDTDQIIDDISVLDQQDGDHLLGLDKVSYIDYTNGVLSLVVPYEIEEAYLNVLGGGLNSKIYVNGEVFTPSMISLAEGVNTFEIYIISEYGLANENASDGKSETVTISITRAISPKITIKSLGLNEGDKVEETNILFGADYELTASLQGYQIKSVKINNVEQVIQNSYRLENVTEDCLIEISYEPLSYTITVSVPDGHGSVSADGSIIDDHVDYTYGNYVQFQFIPDEGYQFKGYTITMEGGIQIGGTSASPNIGGEGNYSISVEFEILHYKITFDLKGEGSVTPSDDIEIAYGTSQTYSINAAQGYRITAVLVDGQSVANALPYKLPSTQNSYTFENVKSNHTLTVEFEPIKYTISVVSNNFGSVNPGDDCEYEYGDDAVYTFTPNLGYHIDSISINGINLNAADLDNAVKNGYQFTSITSNHTIQVIFAINTYTITVQQSENGTISEAKEYYDHGSSSDPFIITPAVGCHLEYILIDGVQVDPVDSYTFVNITSDHTISAVFKGDESSYKIYHHFQKLEDDSYEDPVFVSEETALVNAVVQYLAPTFPGFESQPIGALTVQPNGVSEIHVYYNRLSYTLTVIGEAGMGNLPLPQEYRYGEAVTVSIELNNGYRWNGYISDNESLLASSTDNPYSFNMPAGNVNLTVDVTAYYTIEVQETEFGFVSVPAEIYEFEAGEDFSITYEPYDGYRIRYIKIDGVIQTDFDDKEYIFKNINSNHIFYIEFEQITYHITISFVGTGTSNFDEDHELPFGSNYTFTLNVQEGYELINVNIDDVDYFNLTEYTFNNILEDHKITVQIEQVIFTIRVRTTGNGTVNPAGDSYVLYGSDKVLIFIPEEGYYVKNVHIGNRGDLGEIYIYTFTNVKNDYTVEVEFEQYMYTISYNQPEHGSILPEGPLTLPYGSDQVVTFIPEEGYKIKNVKINDISVGPLTSYTFLDINSDQNVEVEFEQITFTLEINTLGQGSILPEGPLTLPYGTDQEITITPEEGYYISRVEIDGRVVEIENSYVFENIVDDHSIYVEFEQLTYTIEVETSGEGTVNLDYLTTVVYGETKLITITPGFGQRIKSVIMNDETMPVASSYTLENIKEDYTIYIEFEQIEFTISIQKIGNGTISPDQTHTIEYNENETLNFFPDFGYRIKDVIVDGVSIGAQTSYSMINIRADHTISVEFEEIFCTITVLCGANGTSNMEETTVVSYDSNLTCRFTPNEGFIIDDILVDGISVGNETEAYYFSNISTDHVVEAYFIEIKYEMTIFFGPNGTVTYPTEIGNVTPKDKVVVVAGNDFELNITPNASYIADIWVNGEKVETTDLLQFTNVQMNHIIQIEFNQLVYLEISSEGNGTVPESASYEWMVPVTLVFTPDAGYKVKEVLIDGNSVGAVENYTFPNLVANHDVHVIFDSVIYEIHYTIEGKGKITGNKDLNNLVYMDTCTVTITPDSGWEIGIVFVDGIQTEVVNNEISIKNIDKDVEIVVYFSEIPVKSIPLWVFILLGAIILLLIIILIIVSIWNKKRTDRYRY